VEKSEPNDQKRKGHKNLKPFQPGPDPRRGRGPKPGARSLERPPGRPRDEWKAWLRSLIDSPESRAAIEAVACDPNHPAYARVLQWAAERGYGKETEHVEVTGNEGGPLEVRVTRKVVRPDAG
jgi:hypothetical protein